ncbi:MAG: hypothetical protein AB8C95_00265 [Phycisphaeraceae bacterium]
MRCIHRLNSILWLTAITLGLITATPIANAGDLPAASEGQHLWLIQQAPADAEDKDAKPKLTIYHLPTDTETYFASKLDPILGELMPRGITAGDGRLLLINTDRQLTTIRPVWSDLLRSWEYRQRTLTALPEGCTLLSLAMGDHGPWALVKVQSRELLEQLDHVEQKQKRGTTSQQMLNRALGLPEALRWGDTDKPKSDEADAESKETGEGVTEPATESTEDSEPVESIPPQEQEQEQAVEPTLPAYRLIHLRSSKWVSSPLPKDFAMPRER